MMYRFPVGVSTEYLIKELSFVDVADLLESANVLTILETVLHTGTSFGRLDWLVEDDSDESSEYDLSFIFLVFLTWLSLKMSNPPSLRVFLKSLHMGVRIWEILRAPFFTATSIGVSFWNMVQTRGVCEIQMTPGAKKFING